MNWWLLLSGTLSLAGDTRPPGVLAPDCWQPLTLNTRPGWGPGLHMVPLLESHFGPSASRPSTSTALRGYLALCTPGRHPGWPSTLQVTFQAIPSRCQRTLLASVLSCLPLAGTSCCPCHLWPCPMWVKCFFRNRTALLPRLSTSTRVQESGKGTKEETCIWKAF